jgi:hypothetical protein
MSEADGTRTRNFPPCPPTESNRPAPGFNRMLYQLS